MADPMPDNSPIAQEISRLIQGLFDAFQNNAPYNPHGVTHPDATIWDVFTPELIHGEAERRKFHKADRDQMMARGPLTLTVAQMVVDAWDNTALARYYVNFVYQPPNATSGRVRITDVFRKIDGRWRIIHHHEGMVPSGIPPITESKAEPTAS